MFMNAQFAASNTNHEKGTEATVFQPFWSLLFRAVLLQPILCKLQGLIVWIFQTLNHIKMLLHSDTVSRQPQHLFLGRAQTSRRSAQTDAR